MLKWIGILMVAGLSLPSVAGAAGLGQLNVASLLGQPLHGEIDIVSVRKEDTGALSARLASPEAYRQANLEYGSVLGGINVSVLQRANGQPYIRVTSPQAVNEPYLNLLIELNWPSGKVVRQYSALLDPPGYASAPQAAAPAAEPRPAPAARASTAVAAPAPATATVTVYGPVRRGETLSKIAASLRPEGVSLEQMLVGILIANPEAFINSNINRLKAGATLQIPNQAAVTGLPRDKARQDVRVQTADWNRYRRRLADSPGAPSEQPSDSPKRASVRISDEEGKGSKDVLRLSTGAKASSTAERVQNLEEELIARDRALKEANARIKELEKAVKETSAKK